MHIFFYIKRNRLIILSSNLYFVWAFFHHLFYYHMYFYFWTFSVLIVSVSVYLYQLYGNIITLFHQILRQHGYKHTYVSWVLYEGIANRRQRLLQESQAWAYPRFQAISTQSKKLQTCFKLSIIIAVVANRQ